VIGTILSVLVALAFFGLAVGATFAPKTLSENYGIPVATPEAFAYVKGLGARDGVLGLLVLAFVIAHARGALGATVALSALVGASDFAIVFSQRGLAARNSLLIHGVGTVGLLVVWGLVRAGW
jgi:hypothetical protein